jgi:membrane protease YdiL (CAAX protease family)
MTVIDHLLAVVLVVVLPALSARDVPRLARRAASDPAQARTRLYFENMAILWGLTTALVAGWWWAGRPVRDLGLQLPGSASGWWWTLLICGVGIGVIVQQAAAFARSPDAHATVRKQFELQPALMTVLPATPKELRVYCGAAVTAGVCEEVQYRGYLLWYFQSLVPGAFAIAAAVLAFGVAHAYQGVRGIFATGMAGALAMAVYLLTESLLAPILLHATLDLVNGFTLYRVIRESTAASAP